MAIWAGTGTGAKLRLLETSSNSFAVFDGLAGVVVEPGAEPCEGLELFELGVGKLEISRRFTVGRLLRLAAHPRDGAADIDRGEYARFEQGRREVDLAVCDRDQIGRNVGGDVLRFGLDDRQGGERSAAQFGAQTGRPLEQSGMDVEDVSGKGLASRGTPEQERQLAVGAGVLREIVVDDQHVTAAGHELLGDAGRGVGRDEDPAGRVIAFSDDDHGVVERCMVAQVGDDLGDGGCALADGAIDANDVLIALVEDGVDRDRRLAGPAITHDQLALAAADRNQRVDDLESGLQRHGDRGPVHDRHSRAFDRQARACEHSSFAVEWQSERIDDTPQQPVADRHVHDPARSPDFVARVHLPVVAEHDDADLLFVYVEGDARHAAAQGEQLVEADPGEAGHPGDTRRDARDGPDLVRLQLRLEGLAPLSQGRECRVEAGLQAVGHGVHALTGSGSALASCLVLGLALALGLALESAFGAGWTSGRSFSARSSETPSSSDVR